MNNKINSYLMQSYTKVLLNFLFVGFCLGLILNLFEEIEFLKTLEKYTVTYYLNTFLYT